MVHPLGTSRLSDPGVHGLAERGAFSPGRLLAYACLLWLAIRFLPAPDRPPPVAQALFASIRAAPSAQAGRLAVSGLPAPQEDPLELHRYPSWRAATRRLLAQVEEANEDLAALTARISGRVESFPNGTAGLQSAGRVTVFRGVGAQHLTALGNRGRDRPWEILTQVRQTLALRLEAPGRLDDLGESAERQAIARLHREVDEALLAAERLTAEAVEQFRSEVQAIPRAAAGPFRRRGSGLLLEIVLAALIGGLLRETVQASRGRIQPGSTLILAPALATGVVLLLEGSRLLPVHPLEGVSRLFLPLSFAVGFSTGALLEALGNRGRAPGPSREEPRLVPDLAPARTQPAAPAEREETKAGSELRRTRPGPHPEGRPPTGRAERARLPFFPRRR